MRFYNFILTLVLILSGCKSGSKVEEKQNAESSKVVFPYREGKLWGLATSTSEIILKPQYAFITKPYTKTSPQLFEVFDKGKWGVIDEAGKVIIPIQYWNVKVLSKAILVHDTPDDKKGLYNFQGKSLLAPEYDDISNVYSDEKWEHLLFIYKAEKVGVYDLKQEKIIINPEYELKSLTVSNKDAGVFPLYKGEYLALFNSVGKQVTDFIYKDYTGGTKFSEGYAKVQDKNGLWGVVDKNGKETVSCKYKDLGLSVHSQRLPFLGNNEKWGYLDVRNGQEIVKAEYDKARDFMDGYGEVTKDKKMGFVDASGKLVVPLMYDAALNPAQGACFVMKDGDWFPIRLADNTPLTNEKYINGNNFDLNHPYAVISCKSNKELLEGVINKEGKVIIPCKPTGMGITLYPQNAVFQESESEFIVFSLPEGKELLRSTKKPEINEKLMLTYSNNKYVLSDLQGKVIKEIDAVYATFDSDCILISNEEPKYDDGPQIDDAGNIVSKPIPLEERYVPNTEKFKGYITFEGVSLWKD